MRFMTMVKSDESQPAGPPPPALFAAVAQLGEEAKAAGVFVETGGLLPSAVNGARIKVSHGQIAATDGPFTEAKEVIGGYAVYDVKSKEEVMQWAMRFAELHRDLWPGWDGEIEVRQMMDFAG
jgi:hypothetical protein